MNKNTNLNLIIKLTALPTVLLVLFVGCSREKSYDAQYFEYFDTLSTISAYCDSQAQFDALSADIQDALKSYHELFDIYNEYDGLINLKTINDNAGENAITVDERIIDLLSFSSEQYENSSGYVNIAMGSITSIWHEYRTNAISSPENAQIPTTIELSDAAQYIDFSQIEIDHQSSTIYLPEGMSLDVGGIAKGYVTDELAKVFAKHEITSGYINLGGNVKVIGPKPDGSAWNVGIKHYESSSSDLLYLLEIENLSLSTSGSYERFYTAEGQAYHHIINPDTLFPGEYFLSVSVICESAAEADAISTALFNMTLDDGIAFVENLDGVDAIWISADESVTMSEGAKKIIVKEY